MFSSKGIRSEESQGFSLDKTFPVSRWVTRFKVRVLKGLSRFKMSARVKKKQKKKKKIVAEERTTTTCPLYIFYT